MLDLLALEAFVVVAEGRTLREAARLLSCSTSAISRRLDRAEQQTGLPLLQRTTRKTELTQPGTVFLPVARALLLEEERARQAADQLRTAAASNAIALSVAQDATVPGRPDAPEVEAIGAP